MSTSFRFEPMRFPPEAEALRKEVRAFLREEIDKGTFAPGTRHLGGGHNPEFSKKVADRGWIGMTWPKEYGGHERSQIERYVLTEEFLAHDAPVRAHWTADRQSGPVLLKFGQETANRGPPNIWQPAAHVFRRERNSHRINRIIYLIEQPV